MTVSSAVNRNDYAGNGSTTNFAVSFRFLQNSDIKATLRDASGGETLQVETTNYTLTGAGDAGGGTLVMLVAPPTGETLTILRDVPATQETDYVENDEFPAESHEDALDKLTMLVQQQGEDSTRHLGFSETVSDATGSAVELSQDATQRSDKLLGFDASGNIVTKTASSSGLVDQDQQDKRYGTKFSTVAAVKAANPVSLDGVIVNLVAGMVAETSGYYDGWAAMLRPWGAGTYDVATLANVRLQKVDPTWVPDEFGDHTAGNGLVLMLRKSGNLLGKQYGARGRTGFDATTALQAALDEAAILGVDVDTEDGIFPISGTGLLIDNNAGLIGAGQAEEPIIGGGLPLTAFRTLIEYSGTGDAISIRGTFSPFIVRSNINIGGFRLLTRSTAQNGISAHFLTRYTIKDIYFDGIPQNAQLEMLSCFNGIVEECYLKGGQTYNLIFDISASDPVFSGQTIFRKCDFWAGGIGTRVAQPAQIMAQLTFDTCHWQSNTRGFEHVGGRPPLLLNPHFENNVDSDFRSTGVNSALIYGGYCNSPNTAAGRVSILFAGQDGVLEGMGFNEHAVGDAVKLSGGSNVVRSCNFRKVDGSVTTMIRVEGGANKVEQNSFIANTPGAMDCITIDASASRTLLGYQKFDATVLSGRVTDGASDTILVDRRVKRTDQIDLAGGAYRIAFPSLGVISYLTDAKIVYPNVIAAGAGTNIDIGKSIAPSTNLPTFYANHTTIGATGSFSEEVITLSADKSIAATDILNVNSAGAQAVAATGMVEIGFLPYRLFD